MITPSRSDLTKILLVACDQSYWSGLESNNAASAPITAGTALAEYLDSTGAGANAFPNTMPGLWNALGLSPWTVEKRYDDPTTGFGATLYKKANGDGTSDYIVAMQGTR